jgi:hypothetical protein
VTYVGLEIIGKFAEVLKPIRLNSFELQSKITEGHESTQRVGQRAYGRPRTFKCHWAG